MVRTAGWASSDAARTTRHNKLMVPKLMEAAAAKFSDEVSSGEFECAVQFGFCAKASCTRHDASKDGVEVVIVDGKRMRRVVRRVGDAPSSGGKRVRRVRVIKRRRSFEAAN